MNILNKIIENLAKLFDIIQKLDIIGKAVIIGLMLLSVYSLKNCSGREVDSLKIEVEQTKQKVKTLGDSVITLQTTVDNKETTITKLKFEISLNEKKRVSLVSRQRELEARRMIEKDTVTIIALQDSTIDNLKTQVAYADTVIQGKDKIITEREQQVSLLQNAIGISNTRADLLQTELDKVMNSYKKETKILGFIPKPTRKTAFISGVTIGVITGIVIAK
jgi:chromosome segregation ATPase